MSFHGVWREFASWATGPSVSGKRSAACMRPCEGHALLREIARARRLAQSVIMNILMAPTSSIGSARKRSETVLYRP